MGSRVVSQTRTTSGSPRMRSLGKCTYGLRHLRWQMRRLKNYLRLTTNGLILSMF
jgi:hypothetical protein